MTAPTLQVGEPVSDFCLPGTSQINFVLSEQGGKPLVLYFYPKDNTPGCTSQASQFRDQYPEFVKAGCRIFGISRDSLRSHENFKTKLGLPFELLADTEEIACQLFQVIKMKKLYGKEVRGIERSTFLIDAQGRLAKEWRGVKVEAHAASVLEAVLGL